MNEIRSTFQKNIERPYQEVVTDEDIKTARVIKLFGDLYDTIEHSHDEMANEFLNEIVDLSFTQPSVSSLAIKLLKSF